MILLPPTPLSLVGLTPPQTGHILGYLLFLRIYTLAMRNLIVRRPYRVGPLVVFPTSGLCVEFTTYWFYYLWLVLLLIC